MTISMHDMAVRADAFHAAIAAARTTDEVMDAYRALHSAAPQAIAFANRAMIPRKASPLEKMNSLAGAIYGGDGPWARTRS